MVFSKFLTGLKGSLNWLG